jgi:hypothetical protein
VPAQFRKPDGSTLLTHAACDSVGAGDVYIAPERLGPSRGSEPRQLT